MSRRRRRKQLVQLGSKPDVALHRQQPGQERRDGSLLSADDLQEDVLAHPKNAIRVPFALEDRQSAVVDDESPASDSRNVEPVRRLDAEGPRRLDDLLEIVKELP